MLSSLLYTGFPPLTHRSCPTGNDSGNTETMGFTFGLSISLNRFQYVVE